MADHRVIRVPESLGNGLQERVGTDFVDVALNVTTSDEYMERFAGGANGLNGAAQWSRNATITNIALGRYSVAFASAHPDGNEYHVSLAGMEDLTNRDNPKVVVVTNSKTANGFQLMVTIDDNGGTADTYDNSPWSFSVDAPVTVVTGVAPA